MTAPGERMEWTIRIYETVSSTQDVARRLGREAAPEGTVVVAGRQTAGRGRGGNTWFSPAGTGLWMSCILRPDIDPRDLPGLSILAAVSAAEALERCSGSSVSVKWPNDLYLENRKLGGILCEAETSAEGAPAFVAAGIGINLRDPAGGFPAEIRATATSVRTAAGTLVSREELLAMLLEHLGRRYDDYRRRGFSSIREAFSRRDVLRGRNVALRTAGRLVRGRAEGAGERGGLLLRVHRDRIREFITGEVVEWGEVNGSPGEDIREGGSP
jgi:BirA family biotin operon repressor/biotin-[acetyl-CoA-carboxylase] ligase